MRKIKFRAWLKKENRMIDPVIGLDFSMPYPTVQWFDSIMDVERNIVRDCFFEECELMQFTGIRDKNGAEIYEGDIVKQTYHKVTGSYDDYETFDGHHIGEVVITAKGVCMRKPLCYSEETDETKLSNQYKNVAGYRSVVIGNIYENTDLLELALAPSLDSNT